MQASGSCSSLVPSTSTPAPHRFACQSISPLTTHHLALYCSTLLYTTFPTCLLCVFTQRASLFNPRPARRYPECQPSHPHHLISYLTLRRTPCYPASAPFTKLSLNIITRQALQISISLTPKSSITLVSRRADQYRDQSLRPLQIPANCIHSFTQDPFTPHTLAI